MFSRLYRTAISFVVVLAVYFIYSWTVVPLVEPEAVAVEPSLDDGSGSGTDAFGEPTARPDEPLLARIRPFLPDDGWEFDPQTMMMGSDQFTLLIHDYDTSDHGTLVIQPCTLVFFPDGQATAENPEPSVIVMRAPHGAELTFEDGVDLTRLKMGRMQHCHLRGNVTIDGILVDQDDTRAFAKMEIPNTESSETGTSETGVAVSEAADTVVERADAQRPRFQRLHVATSNVQMDENRVWTDEIVKFSLGENRGSGRRLSIEMVEVEEITDGRTEKKRDVQSIAIHEEVKLQLAMAEGDNPLGAPADDAVAGPGAASEQVEITSRGPFRFDALSLVATFEEQVDVMRNGADGPVDHLACELLSVFFARGGSDKIEPRRIEAAGHPVIGRRQAEDAELRCERLIYQLDSGEISLKSTSDVLLRRGEDKVVASHVRFQPGPQGSIGEILASGKGSLQANLPDKSQGQISASWTKELRLRPHEGKTLLSVIGDSTVRFAEMGKLSSNEIWLWLLETPAEAETTSSTAAPGANDNAPRFTPHSMLANGRVTIDSQQLVGHTDRLEMWFTPIRSLARPAAQPVKLGGAPGPAAQPADPLAAQANGAPRSRYQVRGDLVRVQVATDGRATALRDVTIAGNVEMRELAAAGAAEKKALLVRGASLELLGAHVPNTRLVVTGSDQADATVEVRGLTLTGAEIKGNKAGNTLEVNGPGKMTLPMNQDLTGRPAAAGAAPLTIDWKGGMRFDGQQVSFNESVTATTPHQLVRTSRLIATLTRDIDFTNPGRVNDIGLQTIYCPDEVSLENRTVENGQLKSIDRMELRNLQLDQASGDLQASGPGWIKTHRFGNQMALAGNGAGGNKPRGGVSQPRLQPAAEPAAAQLSFLRVDFQQSMAGNFRQKRLTFLNQVKCVYGPVRDWQQELDSQGFTKPGPKDVLLSCDRLAIQEMPGGRRDQQNFDLDATGNMRVDGEQFSAQGNRLSYNTGKEMLTLEGTPQRDAELWRDKPGGGARAYAAARKINFWKNTNRVKVDGARFLDLNGGPPGQ